MLPAQLNDSGAGASHNQLEKRIMITSVTDLKENDAQWAQRHNAQLMREHMEEKKQQDAEIERRRQEWNNTPAENKVCDQCGLKLDPVTVAKIGESPMMRHQHSFCDSIQIAPGVVQGLVGLLKEVFGDDPIPLSGVEQIIAAWKSCGGHCSISKLKLYFPVEETKNNTKPREYSALTTPMQQWQLEREAEEKRSKLARDAALHTPVLVFDSEGTLTLVSRTIQKWREGLSDLEFFDLIQTLHGELRRPQESQNWNPQAVGGMTQRNFR